MADPVVDPTAPLQPVTIPQRLEIQTVRVVPEAPALLRLETWTEGTDPQFYFLTPEQALAWAGRIVRQASVAQAWNRPVTAAVL